MYKSLGSFSSFGLVIFFTLVILSLVIILKHMSDTKHLNRKSNSINKDKNNSTEDNSATNKTVKESEASSVSKDNSDHYKKIEEINVAISQQDIRSELIKLERKELYDYLKLVGYTSHIDHFEKVINIDDSILYEREVDGVDLRMI